MSHSTVLIIGDNPEEQLAPFDEQPSDDSPYLDFTDCTDEINEAWENGKFDAYVNPDNPDEWKAKSYRVGDEAPLGWEEKELPLKMRYPGIPEMVDSWFGYQADDDGVYGYYSNPDAKWDWYQLGGRWTGELKVVANPKHETRVGDPGIMTDGAKWGYADQLCLEDLDIEGMREEARVKANETYGKFEVATDGIETPPTWDEIREGYTKENIQEARDKWHSFPWVKALNKARLEPFMADTHEYFCVNSGGREEFVRRAMDSAFSTYALLIEGQWYQRGEMGWWGMATDEVSQDEWQAQFNKLIEGLPGDTLISLYDVHI